MSTDILHMVRERIKKTKVRRNRIVSSSVFKIWNICHFWQNQIPSLLFSSFARAQSKVKKKKRKYFKTSWALFCIPWNTEQTGKVYFPKSLWLISFCRLSNPLESDLSIVLREPLDLGLTLTLKMSVAEHTWFFLAQWVYLFQFRPCTQLLWQFCL